MKRVDSSSNQKALARLEWLGELLDSSIPIGNTGYRVGIDPFIGLIPVVGDVVGALLGSYIIIEAARLGVSRITLGRMILNLGLDSALGVVPFVGDLFDFTFKANIRNVQLLREARVVSVDHPERRLTSAFFLTVGVTVAILIAIVVLSLMAVIHVIGWILN